MNQLVFVDFNGDFFIPSAIEIDFRYTVRLLEYILKIIICLGIYVIQWPGRLHGNIHDRSGIDIPLNDDRLFNSCRETPPYGIDFLRRINGRRISIGRKIQFQCNPRLPV